MNIDNKPTCTITKIEGGEAMRTTTLTGILLKYPRLNENIFILGEPLDKNVGNIRMFNTSRLVECELLPDNQGIKVTTETGSKYILKPVNTMN